MPCPQLLWCVQGRYYPYCNSFSGASPSCDPHGVHWRVRFCLSYCNALIPFLLMHETVSAWTNSIVLIEWGGGEPNFRAISQYESDHSSSGGECLPMRSVCNASNGPHWPERGETISFYCTHHPTPSPFLFFFFLLLLLPFYLSYIWSSFLIKRSSLGGLEFTGRYIYISNRLAITAACQCFKEINQYQYRYLNGVSLWCFVNWLDD